MAIRILVLVKHLLKNKCRTSVEDPNAVNTIILFYIKYFALIKITSILYSLAVIVHIPGIAPVYRIRYFHVMYSSILGLLVTTFIILWFYDLASTRRRLKLKLFIYSLNTLLLLFILYKVSTLACSPIARFVEQYMFKNSLSHDLISSITTLFHLISNDVTWFLLLLNTILYILPGLFVGLPYYIASRKDLERKYFSFVLVYIMLISITDLVYQPREFYAIGSLIFVIITLPLQLCIIVETLVTEKTSKKHSNSIKWAMVSRILLHYTGIACILISFSIIFGHLYIPIAKMTVILLIALFFFSLAYLIFVFGKYISLIKAFIEKVLGYWEEEFSGTRFPRLSIFVQSKTALFKSLLLLAAKGEQISLLKILQSLSSISFILYFIIPSSIALNIELVHGPQILEEALSVITILGLIFYIHQHYFSFLKTIKEINNKLNQP